MITEMNNAQYYIDRYSVIPDSLWAVGQMFASDGRKCALGHLTTDESFGLHMLLSKAGFKGPAVINDNQSAQFPQETPKARILAALEEARKAGF